MSSSNVIILPSFIRRISKADTLKNMIRSKGGLLQRQGKSRNWLLKASTVQLHSIIISIEAHDESTWFWLVKYLKKQYQAHTIESLTQLARCHQISTINKLISTTDCTIAQARRVIDELEDL